MADNCREINSSSSFETALGKKRAGKKDAGNNSAIKRVLGEMSAR